MIPPVLSDETKSAAEREIFARLARTDLGAGWSCLHSLNIPEHEHKLVGEIDFVVIGPRGLFVLEVKGGGVTRRNGIWTFSDRFGREHRKSEGPFEQAQSGMFSLRKRINAQLGHEATRSLVCGFGVLFPDCSFRVQSIEWTREMIYDASGAQRTPDLRTYLSGLFGYWEERYHEGRPTSPETIKEILRFLRPDFDRVPSLNVRAGRIVRTMEELTDEQYAQLDCIEENPRILCRGGAGTGKTFLAAELARRQAARGKRVLLACSNPVLATFLRARIPAPLVTVECVGADSSLARRNVLRMSTFDALVVDEGQDLLYMTALDDLDARLKGGLTNGEWCIFLDPNRQTGLVGRYEPDALEYLKACGAVSAKLSRNCRNTEPIVIQTRLLTAADVGTPRAGEGPPVTIEFYDSTAAQAQAIDKRLAELRAEGIAPSDITIISARILEDSCVTLTNAYREGAVQLITPVIGGGLSESQLTFSTIRDFKGLENNFVLVVDIDTIGSDPTKTNLLYVAMTRARVALWMALHASLRAEIASVMKKNLGVVLHSDAPAPCAGTEVHRQ